MIRRALPLFALLCAMVALAQRPLGQPIRTGEVACPASFAAADGGCSANGVIRMSACRYPQGNCFCRPPFICSGVRQPPAKAEAYRWVCEAGKVRPDGCPWEQPAEDSPCTGNRVCAYAPCGGSILECKGAHWTLKGLVSPPP